ncbi:MAG: methyltransferase domain-containing protein [Phormidesmis sp.]
MGTCNVCGSAADEFADLLNLPIYCNLLWDNQQAAIDCPKGDIRLAFCQECGAISNTVFDPAKLGYSQDYENSLHYSARFQEYATALANRLVQKHDLNNKTIIEIGCGKGDFLVSLCQLGHNTGFGFDNSYVERDEYAPLGEQVTFIQDFYSEQYADYQGDFVCCRQVLEHIQTPNDLLKPLRGALKSHSDTGNKSAIAFFEVPNALYTFKNMMVWDIIYEHCTYFTPVSLTYVFNTAGYDTAEVQEEFGSQFISIEAQLSPANQSIPNSAPNVDASAVKALANDIAQFESKFRQQQQQWTSTLDRLFQNGKKVVIWGSGSKGVTFLNLLPLKGKIKYAVDINPRKQGKFIPGGGQEIVAPEHMKTYQPDVVIVMNPLYQEEIKSSLVELGLNAQVLTTEDWAA